MQSATVPAASIALEGLTIRLELETEMYSQSMVTADLKPIDRSCCNLFGGQEILARTYWFYFQQGMAPHWRDVRHRVTIVMGVRGSIGDWLAVKNAFEVSFEKL